VDGERRRRRDERVFSSSFLRHGQQQQHHQQTRGSTRSVSITTQITISFVCCIISSEINITEVFRAFSVSIDHCWVYDVRAGDKSCRDEWSYALNMSLIFRRLKSGLFQNSISQFCWTPLNYKILQNNGGNLRKSAPTTYEHFLNPKDTISCSCKSQITPKNAAKPQPVSLNKEKKWWQAEWKGSRKGEKAKKIKPWKLFCWQ